MAVVGDGLAAALQRAASILAGTAAATLVFTAQLSKPYYYTLIGLGVPICLAPTLHWLEHVHNPACEGRDLASKGFTRWVRPLAALHLQAFVYSLIFVNVLFAARWFLGVERSIKVTYQMNALEVEYLKMCGEAHPTLTASPSCPVVLAAFLAHPWAIYIHGTGAICSLAIGPLQLWEGFRKRHPKVHKRIGYLYAACILVGTVGAISLIVHSVSGVAAGAAFMVLLTLWDSTLIIAIYLAQEGRYTEHRQWALRNYALTFSAVPFRFLPSIFSGMGASKDIAYALGAWGATLSVVVLAEAYLYLDRSRAVENDNHLTDEVGIQVLPSARNHESGVTSDI